MDTGISNRSEGIELAEALQLYCTAERTGQMTFYSSEKSGLIFLQHGQPIHATYDTIEGEEAIYQMLNWPVGSVDFFDEALPQSRTIILTWEQVLFEGARRADGADPSSSSPLPFLDPYASQVIHSGLQGGRPKITILSQELPEESYFLDQEYIHIGRVEDNDICLPSPSVSSRHCLFHVSGKDIILRDLNSSNGTFVNGKQIIETILQLGDNIQVGSIQLKLESSIRRPKLRTTSSNSSLGGVEAPTGVKSVAQNRPSTHPLPSESLIKKTGPLPQKRDTAPAYAGNKSITYDDLKTEQQGSDSNIKKYLLILLLLALLSGLALGGYYLFIAAP